MTAARSTRADLDPAPAVDPRRTRTLDGVLGNDAVRAFVRRAWREGRLPQALLLSGPEGIGKTTLAWALAREIAADGGDPASHPGALKIERGVHPDVIEIGCSGSASAMILVDQIRELEARSATAPLEAPRKIALIEPADRMNEAAANGLLKLLEEPPPRLILMLITPEPNRLLPTIRSRCTPLEMEPVEEAVLAPWLRETAAAAPERATLAARLAQGRPGRALALLQSKLIEVRAAVLDAVELLVAQGFAAVFGAAHRLIEAQEDLASTLTVLLALLRDALALRAGAERALNEDLAARLAALGRGRDPRALLEAAELVERAAAEADFFYTPQARAHFVECLMIEVGRRLRR